MILQNDNIKNDSLLLKKIRRYRLWIFTVISLTYLLSYFHRAAPAVVGPVIMKEFSLAPTAVGFIGSMYFWAYAATALPSGILSDTWGVRKTIGSFVLLGGFGGFLFANGSNVAIMGLGRFLIGFGFGVVYVAAMRFLADWYEPDEMATYSGILLAVGNIGALISTAPLVIIMNKIGWRNSFSLVAGITLIASLVAYIIIRNKPAELGFITKKHIAELPSALNGPKDSLIEAIKVVLGNKKFYLLGILLFSYYGSFMGVGSLWAGPYLQNIYGVTKETAGQILMMYPLGMVIGCPLTGYLSDKILKSRKKVLLWGGMLHALCYIPLIFSTAKMTLITLYLLFLWYGLSGSAFVSCFACAKETCESRFAGTAVGSLNIFLFCGGAFYQNIMGMVIDRYEVISPGVFSLAAYKSAFLVPFCGLLIGIICFSYFKEEHGSGIVKLIKAQNFIL